MKKSRGIAVLLLTAIVTVFFCYVAAVGIGPTGTGSAKNINTGLDLAGGVSITYQAKDSNPSKEDMSDTVYKMQQRVSQYSTEAQAYQEGSNRITMRFQEYQMQMRSWKNLESQVLCILSIRQMQMETRILQQETVRVDMFLQEVLRISRKPDLLYWKVQTLQMLREVLIRIHPQAPRNMQSV